MSKVNILGDGTHTWWCPACNTYHGGKVNGNGYSWSFDKNFDSPTFNPSFLVKMERKGEDKKICHTFVRNGKIQYLNDCTHEMAGKTIDMVDVDDMIKSEYEIEMYHINELIRLKKENPNTKIMCMVAWEDISNDDYYRVTADMEKPTLEKFVVMNEMIITDEEEIKERIYSRLEKQGVIKDFFTAKLIDDAIEEEFEKLEWDHAIFINIG